MQTIPDTAVTYTSDGSSDTYPVPFNYLKPEDVFATVDGIAVDLTFISAGLAQVSDPGSFGSTIRIYRSTPVEEVRYAFNNGVPFLLRYLDANAEQLLYVIQEFIGLAQEAVQTAREFASTVQDLSGTVTDLQAGLNSLSAASAAADAHLQAQISGGAPLEASAFSPISWHDQVIQSSVTIPPGKNAWSFGPGMTIAPGAAVTISDGSSWTIASGEVQE